MSTLTYIYALAEPFTGAVRYVGKSNNPRGRLNRHISSARSYRRHTHLANWVRAMVIPVLLVLEAVVLEDWPLAERKWIARYKALGARLINHTAGGDGHIGGELGAETRSKISVAAKLRYEDPEEREKARQTMLGRVVTREHRSNLSRALKGREVWNKGLTKETDPRVAANAAATSKALIGRTPWNKGLRS